MVFILDLDFRFGLMTLNKIKNILLTLDNALFQTCTAKQGNLFLAKKVDQQ